MTDKYIESSKDDFRNVLQFQFDISWQMLEIHLSNLEDEECLWRPAPRGLHVFNNSGVWQADWPDTEAYDIGPSSIGWLTWHITFWWSMVLNHSFGSGTLTREDVHWPGSVENFKNTVFKFRDEWKNILSTMSHEELLSSERTKWPFNDRPFYELAGWLNLELMKNASEIGYCRFLYGSRK